MLRPFLFVFLYILATAAHSEEIGQINAQLDGASKDWYIIAVKRGEETVMTGSFTNGDRLSSMTMQGHTEDRFSTRDVVSINADWLGPYEAGKTPMMVEIIYMPDGMSNPFYTSDQVPGGPTLTIEAGNLDTDPGQITGSFTGKVCLVAKLYGEPDPNDCKDITGTFDTQVMIR